MTSMVVIRDCKTGISVDIKFWKKDEVYVMPSLRIALMIESILKHKDFEQRLLLAMQGEAEIEEASRGE